MVQVGHISNILPTTLKHKIYDFKDVSKALNMNTSFIIGAGGGYWTPREIVGEVIIINTKSLRSLLHRGQNRKK